MSRQRICSEGGAEKEVHYRIAVLGAAEVGKSSIISQFLYDRFNSEYKETVEELYRGQYNIDGIRLTLDILDTAGHHEFPAMRKLAISSSDAFILVYSMTDNNSFDEVKKLREDIIAQREKVPIVIVGNKSDISSNVSPVDKETAASIACVDWETGFVQASAKDNTNIVGIFQELLRLSDFPQPLSPAVRRRRMSMPTTSSSSNSIHKHSRNSCVVS
ncbi:GTP-binding protein Rhes,GTP-binding protein drn-1,GTP-binding protein Di-Ras2 [Mytilus coruscus]|uniref:GTP-binding protein Rhes,GTP-binding protein drn-1,GTP-binding protein Di-Ras2 n=1 Tax=Mytilus coruscus TaxID=42192 RepID=A0A6J8D0W1_MYTCO|nr:GTP-binding protein Rhes,GTP-binding protein drn-1,GTP-binding protein Di-Ras2 [Mytilus coruscus]